MDANPKASEIKKYLMWSKVNQLKREGHSISRISKLTGLDRKTVRKYVGMSEEEFRQKKFCVRSYSSRLDKYRGFIVERLASYPFMSSGAIHAHLRLNFPDLENFNQKTVYNYVRKIRREENIPVEKEGSNRPYCMLEQTAPGEYAQADFGEKWIDAAGGGKKKVYFFAMLLSRWRHKFIWFSDKPFTAELAAYAHELAFEFYGGVPRNIVYDQDKVLLHKENMGDYILTHRFATLIKECGFHPIFCRKADPESKGKVENSVKYVKNNYLAGYLFVCMDRLQGDCRRWMETTANGLPHATTGQIPSRMFEQEERKCLLPYKGVPTPTHQEMPVYTLRKDNTISYKGSYYAVPLGSYKGRGSNVRVLEKDEEIEIYSMETGKLLMRHPLCREKGKLMTNGSCRRNPDVRIEDLQKQLEDRLSDDKGLASQYVASLKEGLPRNVRDNLAAIVKGMPDIGRNALAQAIRMHMDISRPGAASVLQTARMIELRNGRHTEAIPELPQLRLLAPLPDITPEKTQMSTYAAIFN